MKKKMTITSLIAVMASILVLWLVFWVLIYFVLRDGQRHSEEFFVRRISQSLLIDSGRLRYLDGYRGRDPYVFFELNGEIPVAADVRVLHGSIKEYDVKLFNELAARYHLPMVAGNDEDLLNYKGECFDLYMTKKEGGYLILYF